MITTTLKKKIQVATQASQIAVLLEPLSTSRLSVVDRNFGTMFKKTYSCYCHCRTFYEVDFCVCYVSTFVNIEQVFA